MSWNFDTAQNPAPAVPDPANPVPATATAEVAPGFGIGYVPGKLELPGFDFGAATGLWDIGGNGAGVKIDLGLYGATPTTLLDYQVVVGIFASTGLTPDFPYSAGVQFSIPGAVLTGTVIKQTTSSGQWIESTYAWQQLAIGSTPVTLTLSDGPSSSGLLLDSLTFSVFGDLSPIPEPSVSQLGALAAVALGLGALRRSKVQA